jgi:hypothetical protein
MQCKFQNNAVLLRNARELRFITSLDIFLIALLKFGLSVICTRVGSQLVRISEVLTIFCYCYKLMNSFLWLFYIILALLSDICQKSLLLDQDIICFLTFLHLSFEIFNHFAYKTTSYVVCKEWLPWVSFFLLNLEWMVFTDRKSVV